MKQYVFTILFTAAVTLSLSWAVWRLSLKYKLYPGIRERDVHKTPTPRLGGVAMFLGVVAAFTVSSQHPYFAIFWERPEPVYAILVATLLIVWLNAGILLAFVGNEGSQYQLLALGAVLIFAALLNGLTTRRYGGSR